MICLIVTAERLLWIRRTNKENTQVRKSSMIPRRTDVEYSQVRITLNMSDPTDPNECNIAEQNWESRAVFFQRLNDSLTTTSTQTQMGKVGRFRLVDMDGDGRADLVASHRVGRHRCEDQGSGLDEPGPEQIHCPHAARV